MKKNIEINSGIICGEDKDIILQILPELENQFTRRKSYCEFYYKSKFIDLTYDNIEKLSSKFVIEISFDSLEIKVN